MTFEDRFTEPREGHELTCVDATSGVYWCLRCGALWLEARRGVRASRWEAPSQSGRSRAFDEPPPCLPSAEAGADNLAADARLMLHALTHGWRCEPILLARPDHAEAWRWSHDGLLRAEVWSVPGAWADGPVVDAAVRRLLLTAADRPVVGHD